MRLSNYNKGMKSRFMRKELTGMYFLFLLFWILLNGKLNLEILVFGLVISLAVYAFCWKFLGFSPRKDLIFARILGYAAAYALLLIAEIVKANIGVLREIYTEKTEVEPCIVQFTSPFQSEIYNVILADSITLTPGTITVELNGRDFTVHCLDKSMSEGLDSSSFVRLLYKIEKGVNACFQ